MKTYFVRATFDLTCIWHGIITPIYRVYVNDDLFTERKYACSDSQLIRQLLQIQAPVGKYHVTVMPVNCDAEFIVSNGRIEQGPAKFIKNQKITISSWEPSL